MSGPVSAVDAGPDEAAAAPGAPAPPELELLESRVAEVGGTPVRRALPKRTRRTVGAWCFLDHFGPATSSPMAIGPHPHIGLQTVTWLFEGETLHTDSLGSEQLIRPGQLNLMTAGRGVAHAEESPTVPGAVLHGAQLWVALPDATRSGAPAFEHHPALPEVAHGSFLATVLVGGDSPARADTPLLGMALAARPGRGVVPLDPSFEHALVVLEGAVEVDGRVVEPGALAYLGLGRHDLALSAPGPAEALLVGGEPFGEPPLMWWNFVARTRQELDEARADWEAGSDRFGEVSSGLRRIPAPGRR